MSMERRGRRGQKMKPTPPCHDAGTSFLWPDENNARKWTKAFVQGCQFNDEHNAWIYCCQHRGRRAATFNLTQDQIDFGIFATDYANKPILKYFDQVPFKGTINDVYKDDDGIWCFVRYEDDDCEDMTLSTAISSMALYQNHSQQTKVSQPNLSKSTAAVSKTVEQQEEKKEEQQEKIKETTIQISSRGRKRQAVSYKAEDSDDDYSNVGFDNDDEEEDNAHKDRKPKPTKSKPKRLRRLKSNDSDDDFDASDLNDQDDILDIDSECENDGASEDDSDGDRIVKRNKNSKNAGKKSKKGGPATTNTTTGPSPPTGPKKKTMAETFDPINHPLYSELSLQQIRETKQFLDPCGQEATDEVLSRLVGEQVDKILPLLKRALATSDAIGSRENPLKLGTACSGTDAPALALTMVLEHLAYHGHKDVLHYSHAFSCEMEPFKQAYLARNFDSVLYPDICKLTDDNVKDAYGQEQPIPESNMFVAGTSCKNFSMMRANKRLDIEDKGCSGETFLAAVEYLMKFQPPLCVFENVMNAPWAKMGEYITGRIKLSSCDSSKAIKGMTKAQEKQQLEFVYDSNTKNIIVEKVPLMYGVQCGVAVKGFTRPSSPNTIRQVQWPKNITKNKKCFLSDLMKMNGISKEHDTLVFDMPVSYRTRTFKVDTKNFGLPQTRNRVYMFVWRIDNDGDDDEDNLNDLGEYWEEIIKFLSSPVRHSLEAFLLQPEHDNIRVLREALRGPSGRQTKRSCALEPYFWESTSANLPHNKTVRKKAGFEDLKRTLTQWGANGKKRIPPHYWREYLDCKNQREIDVLEILHACAARDAECHDSNFASFVWNVSQNATREKHRTASPGISGCLTPGGDFFLPHLGRPMLGCEKLLIQGIPYFRLVLGAETEVQLGDLAGNAMSLTVVLATMLGALTCKQLRHECRKSGKSPLEILKSNSNIRRPDFSQMSCISVDKENMDSSGNIFKDLVKLSAEAIRTSIWCGCETSGQISLSKVFLQCSVCKISCCRLCCQTTSGYQLESHSTQEINDISNNRNLGAFEAELRKILPPILVFNKEGLEKVYDSNTFGLDKPKKPKHDFFKISRSKSNDCTLPSSKEAHNVVNLASLMFQLHCIKRERGYWNVTYFAREGGIGVPVAEFRIRIGELLVTNNDSDKEIGVLGKLTSFLPAHFEPLVYGKLEPCVIVKYTTEMMEDDDSHQPWMTKSKSGPISASLSISGSGAGESFRKEIGLTDIAEKGVKSGITKNKKKFGEAKKRGEERRWLYPSNWKEWPDYLEINFANESCDNSGCIDVSGTYRRAKCRQTINQGGMWIRQDKQPTFYLLLKPNVSRIGPDCAIISKSISHDDLSEIVATLPEMWQPCDTLVPNMHLVKKVSFTSWRNIPNLKCCVPNCAMTVTSPKSRQESNTLVLVNGLTDHDVSMLTSHCLDNNECNVISLPMVSGQRAQQTVRIFDSLFTAIILQHASRHGIPYDLTPNAPWITLTINDAGDVPFGHCKKIVPPRPVEKWRKDEERQCWDRYYEQGASRAFVKALANRPHAFEFHLDKNMKSLRVNLNPQVVAHLAAANLIQGRGDSVKDIKVSVRLSASQYQTDPILEAFQVPACHQESPTEVGLKKPYSLYERQQKVVTKMVKIENHETKYTELEMSEEYMPGSSGWSLMARAERETMLRGGVIADAIGAGKTVVSIALIIRTLKEARQAVMAPRNSGATLVVVPSHLITQWKNEINKFTTGLNVICVYDYNTLQKFSVGDILSADCVICPVDILETKDYLPSLLRLSGTSKHDNECPQMPQYAGQKEFNGASGVWIPATSQDPYGGGNNPLNQKRRNQSARYTYIYQTAYQKLREKEFTNNKKGVPLEYFEWERVIVDEIHESLCCTKEEIDSSNKERKDNDVGIFKEKNRRAGREFLGLMTRDPALRPLTFRKAIFGLTGTPLLDSPNRVIELASLMSVAYVLGLCHHWRRLERESNRDIFLHYYLEPKQSREIRRNLYMKCQDYINTACCRNKVEAEMVGINLHEITKTVTMTKDEGQMYLKSQSGIPSSKRSFAIKPEDFDVSAGHDITKFLRQNADLPSRRKCLVDICKSILDKDATTKIIVFADGRIGGGISARQALENSDIGCTYLNQNDSNEIRNQKISWYQYGDATKEDFERPRVLVLHFEHAAGLNLQSECYNLILYSPLYVGQGGAASDAVADVSTEMQAIGRVYRPGQARPNVYVYRIECRGPNGEESLDCQLITRNTDAETKSMAVNASD